MAFKIKKGGGTSPETPEALFADLRSRKVPGLLAHQADVLRAYVKDASQELDVALQLPTGSGKTLVGLLIGEWRRRKYGDRVVYLCATNQLVHQVVHQAAASYGMRVLPFTGSRSEYDASAKTEYANSEAIAVTSYWSLFNTNPFFLDPNVIVLDDAHSSENHIATFWSLRIDRHDPAHKTAYGALVGILRGVLSRSEIARMESEPQSLWDNTWTDKIPTPFFRQLQPEISSCLDEATKDTELRYPWGILKDHLDACHMYVGTHAILIRPFIPPTATHLPFEAARQRIYMSATLGSAGDLERMLGRQSIARLPVPEGWDKQGIGRRFFVMPERSLEPEAAEDLTFSAMDKAGRSVVLVPDRKTAAIFRSLCQKKLKAALFNAQEIEAAKAPFVNASKAVAVIANRYDGIDLREDECRLLIMKGFPSTTNLQERFLVDRMGATLLLQDRIRTRVVQGFGRCTRSPTDYAAVILLGESLCNYLLKREVRQLLHPEIQAELEFGIDQSKDCEVDELLANLDSFWDQGKEWREADSEIVDRRVSRTQQELSAASDLRAAVDSEVDYQYALWNGDYVGALESCRAVLAKLNDPALRGYRTLWYYFAGSAASLAFANGHGAMDTTAKEYFRQALQASKGIRWLARLAQFAEATEKSGPDPHTEAIVERMAARIEELGTLHDGKFDQEEQRILAGLRSDDASDFEEAHKRLGLLLGYEADNSKGSGAPDPWWIVDETLCFVFEDHSDGKEAGTITVRKARQAAGHADWIRDKLQVDEQAMIHSVLITPARYAPKDASPHLKKVRLWALSDFRKWAVDALALVRELRRTFHGRDDLVWRAEAMDKLEGRQFAPAGILELTTQTADEGLQEK